MYKGGYDWSKQFRKSARIVGDVIGKYHPHGDQSVYDALVRLVQDFSMSVPLISGQGNFGSIDGDPPAAMRYTETKLGRISQHLTEDLEKNTVNFRSNYDETEKEPEVLPSQYPNILVNGAGGIAVGMATSIPPHNLGEIIDATIAYINNKEITISQLMKYVPGPDFPTGGIIIGKDIIKQGYNKGRGSFKIRGEIDFEEKKGGRDLLIIKSIPYQVNKSILIEKIAQLVRDKKIEGIRDLRDESNREGIRVVIELRKGVEPETVRRQLFKFTNFQKCIADQVEEKGNNVCKNSQPTRVEKEDEMFYSPSGNYKIEMSQIFSEEEGSMFLVKANPNGIPYASNGAAVIGCYNPTTAVSEVFEFTMKTADKGNGKDYRDC